MALGRSSSVPGFHLYKWKLARQDLPRFWSTLTRNKAEMLRVYDVLKVTFLLLLDCFEPTRRTYERRNQNFALREVGLVNSWMLLSPINLLDTLRA